MSSYFTPTLLWRRASNDTHMALPVTGMRSFWEVGAQPHAS